MLGSFCSLLMLKGAKQPLSCLQAKLPANWAAVPVPAKQQIKSTLLSTLATEVRLLLILPHLSVANRQKHT